ncbi:hypothetical protein BH23BAC1_BH23BAC1_02400 [soil metagenome]
MRFFIIKGLFLFFNFFSAFSQISEYPYTQNFEQDFINFGVNVEFLPGWIGNEVRETSSRIFQTSVDSRTGSKALAVQPISSFDGIIIMDLDLTDIPTVELEFWARTARNGTGSRPVLVRISTSTDGGITFIKRENIGDETTFPNQDTEYSLYRYGLPASTAFNASTTIKLEIIYNSAFGEGTAARFLMDDFSLIVGELNLEISNVNALDANTIYVQFNQAIDQSSGEATQNYIIEPGSANPAGIKLLSNSNNTLELKMAEPLMPGNYDITINNVYSIDLERIADNATASFVFAPTASSPAFNELLITEIMADPNPPVALPTSEYIEIFNSTNKSLSLKDLVFSDANSSTLLPDQIILPGSFVLVVPRTRLAEFTGVNIVIGVTNWPTLNVGGDRLSIRHINGTLIFMVNYDRSWYRDAFKSNGGWSLEMIDAGNPCGEAGNWVASIHPSGGTPGRENSVIAIQPDLTGPRLLGINAIDSRQLMLIFNEKIDISSIENAAITGDNLQILSFELDMENLEAILVDLADDLLPGILYSVHIIGITDCSGNLIQEDYNSSTFALPQPAEPLDIVINEVLFNPRSGGVRFIEIYNNSNKYIDLKDWSLGNIADGEIDNLRIISNEAFILAPESYLAITTNSLDLKSNYPKSPAENFLEISSLPSYPAASGAVVLLNNANLVIDLFNYSEDFHSPLIREVRGVSLERISFSAPTNDPNNWRSAASTVDYATPGYKNSQFRMQISLGEVLTIEPKVFAPGNIGRADFTIINYKFNTSGNFGSLSIFDQQGRLIRKIAQNELLATEGFYTWDGTDENHRKVRIGHYLILFEIYNLNGTVDIIKESVAVGKNF